jgi:metallo-beta-lactamase class B
VNNADYPGIAEDYQRSFKILRSLPCDVFLGAHGNFYNLAEKYPKIARGQPNPFIDPAGYKDYVDRMEKNFLARLEEQQKAAK